MHLGFGEMLLVLALALLVFGPKKLPELGSSLGKAIRSFRKATTGEELASAPSSDIAKTAPAQPAPPAERT